MSFEDYLQYFENFEVCYMEKNICSKAIQCDSSHKESPLVFDLYLINNSKVSIQGIKRYWRYNRKFLDTAELILNIVIVSKNEGKLEWIASAADCQNNPIINVELEAGSYLIYAYPNYTKQTYDKPRKYVIDVTSSNFFKFEHI